MAIQFVYDIKHSTIHHISIDSALANDSLYAGHLDWLKEKSLLIRDLGYYSNKVLKEITQKNAYYLSRLKPQIGLYEKDGTKYKRIEMKELLAYMKENNISFLDKHYYISTADKMLSRVCLFLMPEQVREQRLRKNKASKAGKGYTV